MKIAKILDRVKEIEDEKESLSAEIGFKEDELDFISSSIYNLEDELLDLDREKEKLLDALKHTKQLEAFKNKSNFPSDDLHNKFVLASHFTSMEFDDKRRGILNKVKIEEDRIIAMDGYRFLMANTDIPKNLQNTLVSWDERESLEDNAKNSKESVHQYFKYNDLLDRVYTSKDLIKDITVSSFYDKFFLLEDKGIEFFNIGSMQIAFNHEFMSDARNVFKSDLVDVIVPDNSLKPIMFKNSEYEAIILPIRLSRMLMNI